jgi:hypothetical protein
MPLDRRTLLLSPLALGLMALNQQPLPQQWNGGHPESFDPTWNLLATAKVAVDAKSGLMTADFTPDVRRLEGKTMKIEGFMLPLEMGRASIHFALTRRNSGCPFCPPSQPTEAVEIMTTTLVKLTADLITLSGVLYLHPSSDQGMFYQLRQAEVVAS